MDGRKRVSDFNASSRIWILSGSEDEPFFCGILPVMNGKKEAIAQRIAEIEREMGKSDFWQNKDAAQKKIKE